MPRRRALALLVVALAGTSGAGCGRPDVVFCNTDTDCSNGEVCAGGGCVEGTPFRGPGFDRDDDDTDDGGEPVPPVIDPCGTVVDEFDAAAIAEPLWSPFEEQGAEVGLADGKLVVSLPAATPDARAGVVTGPLRFTGRSITAALPEVPSDVDAWAVIEVQDYLGNNDAFFVANGTMLSMGADDAAGGHGEVHTAYDGAAHRFIRMREESGELVFETSRDDSDYFERGRVDVPAALLDEDIYLALIAQAENATASTTAAFNSVSSPSIQCP